MRKSSKRIIEDVEKFLSEGNNRQLVYNFLEKFSQCEVYVRPILKKYYESIGEDTRIEMIVLESREIKNAFFENGIYFDDKKLITRIFGTDNKPGSSTCRWLRNKITHELTERAIKEVCERSDELMNDMNDFINQINQQI